MDSLLAHFLQCEGVEGSKRDELQRTTQEVDELEAQVVSLLAEAKREGKLLSVLSAQRDIKGRSVRTAMGWDGIRWDGIRLC